MTGILGDMERKDADTARRQLGRRVAERRLHLRLNKEEASRLAGVSSITWKRVEDGLRVRDDREAAIEKALGWTPGSFKAVMSGSEPTETSVVTGPTEADDLIERVRRSHWPQPVKDVVIAAIRAAEDTDSDMSLHADTA